MEKYPELTDRVFAERGQSAARGKGIIHTDRFYRESAALLSSDSMRTP